MMMSNSTIDSHEEEGHEGHVGHEGSVVSEGSLQGLPALRTASVAVLCTEYAWLLVISARKKTSDQCNNVTRDVASCALHRGC